MISSPDKKSQEFLDNLRNLEKKDLGFDQITPVASPAQMDDNGNMSTVPAQAYIDKSIASLEKTMSDNLARMENNVANSIVANRVANENLKERLEDHAKRLEQSIAEIKVLYKETSDEVKRESSETQGYISSMKWQAFFFSLALAGTVYFGISSNNSDLIAGMDASFGRGVAMKDAVNAGVSDEVKIQLEPLIAQSQQTNAKVEQLTNAVNKLISTPATPQTPGVIPGPSSQKVPLFNK